jgi:hypothetical protein
MTQCCICATRGKYTRADPTVDGIPQCRLCALEAKWTARTRPSASPRFNPDVDQPFFRMHLLGLHL